MTEHEQFATDIADLKKELDETKFVVMRFGKVIQELIKIDLCMSNNVYGDRTDPEAKEITRVIFDLLDEMGLGAEVREAERINHDRLS